jgi:basic membrane protein A and related proteins
MRKTIIGQCVISLMAAIVLVSLFGQVTEAQKPLKFVYVSAMPIAGDDYWTMGKIGTERAAQKYGAAVEILECQRPEEGEEKLRTAAREGANIIVVLAFEFHPFLTKVAAEFPDVQFLNVDQCPENPPANMHCAVFREHEATFLLGAAAASLTKTQHLGVIGALDIPFLHRFTDVFAEGARYVNPNVQVSVKWIGGEMPFNDPKQAKVLAEELADAGADHIFSAGAMSDYGVFEAAQEKKFFAYGTEINKCPAAPGYIVENIIKRVDVAVVQSVDGILAGTSEHFKSYGLASGGIGIVALASEHPEQSQCVIMEHPDVVQRLKEIQGKIIAGEITIHDPVLAQK